MTSATTGRDAPVRIVRLREPRLAFAVALDATLIRIGLVPALMVLAGPCDRWLPGRARRVDRAGGCAERSG